MFLEQCLFMILEEYENLFFISTYRAKIPHRYVHIENRFAQDIEKLLKYHSWGHILVTYRSTVCDLRSSVLSTLLYRKYRTVLGSACWPISPSIQNLGIRVVYRWCSCIVCALLRLIFRYKSVNMMSFSCLVGNQERSFY